MWTRRAVMATTSLEGEIETAWGLPGRGITRGEDWGEERLCT